MTKIEVRIVCTGMHHGKDDEGRDTVFTHPSREIELLSYDPEARIAVPLRRANRHRIGGLEFDHEKQVDSGSLVELGDVADPRGALWRFTCVSCGRDRPLRDDTLAKILDGYLAAGRASVDISALPARLA